MKHHEKGDGKHHHDTKDGRKPEEHLKHVMKRARGGKMEIEGVPEIGGHPEKAEERTPESGRNRGGAMKKKKDHEKRAKGGGIVRGKHPGHRLDKRARGGRMSPKSPFSGADGPDLGYAKADLPSGSQGMGKDKT